MATGVRGHAHSLALSFWLAIGLFSATQIMLALDCLVGVEWHDAGFAGCLNEGFPLFIPCLLPFYRAMIHPTRRCGS